MKQGARASGCIGVCRGTGSRTLWWIPCLTDKSEVCLPTSFFIVVFFLGKPFLEEDGYGEHTLSLYYAGSGARSTCLLGRSAPPEDPGVDAGGPHTLGLDQPDRLGTLRGESSPI